MSRLRSYFWRRRKVGTGRFAPGLVEVSVCLGPKYCGGTVVVWGPESRASNVMVAAGKSSNKEGSGLIHCPPL
ncbi:MAG: hypothetical protein JWN11_1794 [Hyphomicrobiales bacterium]|nr:hypothetical protein [Hyphomicrobiales bacterium]